MAPPPLLPPSGPAPTNDADAIAAFTEMVQTLQAQTTAFGAIALSASLLLRPYKPKTADALTHGLAGYHPEPLPGSNRAIPKPTAATLLLGLAPQPVGYVPPEIYGIPPDYLSKPAKKYDPTGVVAPGIVKYVLGTEPGAPRMKYYEELEADDFELRVKSYAQHYDNANLEKQYLFFSQPGLQERWPTVRVERIRNIYRDLLISRGVNFTPGGSDLNLPNPLTQPTAITSPLAEGLQPALPLPGVTPPTPEPLPLPAAFVPIAVALRQPPTGFVDEGSWRLAGNVLKQLLTERTDP